MTAQSAPVGCVPARVTAAPRLDTSQGIHVMKIERDTYLVEKLLEASKFASKYAETRDAELFGDRQDAEKLAEMLDSHAGDWYTLVIPSRTIFKHNADKPHRCPVCHTIPDELWEGNRVRRWRIYTCRYGHRFSMLPLITKEYEYTPLDRERSPRK